MAERRGSGFAPTPPRPPSRARCHYILHPLAATASSLSHRLGGVEQEGYHGEGEGGSHGREQEGIQLGWEKERAGHEREGESEELMHKSRGREKAG